MALSRTTYTGDGATTDFTVPFPYLDKTHVKVYLDSVLTTAWSWLTTTSIRLTSAAGIGVAILIKRDTSSASRLVDYVAPSSLNESDLDTDSIQGFYLAQEAVDTANNIAGAAINFSFTPTGNIA